MGHFKFVFSLLFFLGFSCMAAHAQCYGNPQRTGQVCAYSPITLNPSSTCSTCTHSWGGNPVSGQGTAFGTFIFSGNGPGHQLEYPSVTSFNPVFNCTYYDAWEISVGLRPIEAMPALSNGPWDGDTSKIWIYTRTRNNLWVGTPTYEFLPTWSITGGSILSSSIYDLYGNGFVFEDTILIKWNGGGQMMLSESRSTYHDGGAFFWPISCAWNPDSLIAGPVPLAIFNGTACANNPSNYFTYPFPNSSYTWSATNGTVVAGQGTNSAQITMTSNGTVTVVRDSAGTITSESKPIILTNPVVNLGPDQTSCQGNSVTLDAGPGFGSYLWSTGATTQSINVSAAGSYNVTASINGACSAMDTVLVSLIPTTRPNLGLDTSLCTFPILLDAGSGFTSYAWNNGSTSQTISATASNNYQVTVTDANGCTTADSIGVFDRSIALDLGADFSFCGNLNYNLSPVMAYPVTSYSWSTGATTSSISVTGTGPQTIWLHASNTTGCTGDDTITVTGTVTPMISLGADTTVCPSDTVLLDAGAGYNNYSWSGGGNSQFFTADSAGTYSVRVYDTLGCVGYDTIMISNFPFLLVDLGPDINVCQASVTLDAGPGYTSYNWSNGATTQTTTVNVAGQYSVSVTGANGCGNADSIDVSFTPFSFNLGNDTIFCEPGELLLDPQLQGNFTYNWSTGAVSPSILVSRPGSHTIHLTASNNLGCTYSDTILVTINAAPAIQLGGSSVLCRDTSRVLDAGPGYSSYLWSTGATSQSITVNSGGVYSVYGTLANGCLRHDTASISDLIDCVFPGDVNYDGIANMADVIALGSVMGTLGYVRTNASTQWYGQPAPNWFGTLAQGVNTKQADTDGDRYITPDDTLAISANFGSTHTKTGSITTGPEQIRIVPLGAATVIAGDIAYFGVYLDHQSGQDLGSVYGMTLHLDWATGNAANPTLSIIDFNSGWMANAGERLSMQKVAMSSADIAITRTSGQDTMGQGLVMILGFQTDSTMAPGAPVSFAPSVGSAELYGLTLSPTSLNPQVTPLSIVVGNAVQSYIQRHIQIYPIPANNELNVTVEGKPADRVLLINMMGQTVYDAKGAGQENFVIDTQDFPAGQYCVYIQLGKQMLSRKVILQH